MYLNMSESHKKTITTLLMLGPDTTDDHRKHMRYVMDWCYHEDAKQSAGIQPTVSDMKNVQDILYTHISDPIEARVINSDLHIIWCARTLKM